jgi:hypothetical protein
MRAVTQGRFKDKIAAAQRKREQRKRDAEAGLVRVEVTVYEGQQEAVRAHADELRRQVEAPKNRRRRRDMQNFANDLNAAREIVQLG